MKQEQPESDQATAWRPEEPAEAKEVSSVTMLPAEIEQLPDDLIGFEEAVDLYTKYFAGDSEDPRELSAASEAAVLFVRRKVRGYRQLGQIARMVSAPAESPSH